MGCRIPVCALLLLITVARGFAAEASWTRPKPASLANACLWRSALFPGWGQWHAGKPWKGAAYLLCTAAFVYGHATASSRPSSARRELNRWSIIFWLFSLGDAYVDGYMASFDREMDELDAIGKDLFDNHAAEARWGVGLGFRW